MGLVILARRDGSNPIRWICADIREYRQRVKSFSEQGYEIDPYDRY